jgi:hypothetical protein
MLENAFESFKKLLEERLQRNTCRCEADTGSEFFLTLVKSGVGHADVLFEVNHPAPENIALRADKRKKIDLVITPALDQQWQAAIEFKYDHRLDAGGTKTQKAGALLGDIFRLAAIPSKKFPNKYLVYVTDPDMQTYWRHNNVEGVNYLLDTDNQDLASENLLGGEETLSTKIKQSLGAIVPPASCSVQIVYSADLPNRHVLRIFQITP